MTRILTACVIATALLATIPSQASAHYCKAVGLGVSASASSPFIERAKLLALRRCEARAGLHICTIAYCR
jgi:hypothetical protein